MAGSPSSAAPMSSAPDSTLATVVHNIKHDTPSSQTCEADILPIANISRIMKRVLPENAKIAKEAKECVQECVSEFIQFVTSEASERCLQEKRKTINGDDIICALSSLGFDKYVEPLKTYLHKWRESLATLQPALRDKLVQEQKAAVGANIVNYPTGYAINPYPSYMSPYTHPGASGGYTPSLQSNLYTMFSVVDSEASSNHVSNAGGVTERPYESNE
eukprot:Platyproteum_vivax@DN3866_c0_g1_i1.p1